MLAQIPAMKSIVAFFLLSAAKQTRVMAAILRELIVAIFINIVAFYAMGKYANRLERAATMKDAILGTANLATAHGRWP